MGYEEAAEKVQELFFAGKRDEAAAAVPDEFADEISLVGPPARIRERLQAWKKSPVTTHPRRHPRRQRAARARGGGGVRRRHRPAASPSSQSPLRAHDPTQLKPGARGGSPAPPASAARKLS